MTVLSDSVKLKYAALTIYDMLQGDGQPEDIYTMLFDWGFIDENHEWIYDEDS